MELQEFLAMDSGSELKAGLQEVATSAVKDDWVETMFQDMAELVLERQQEGKSNMASELLPAFLDKMHELNLNKQGGSFGYWSRFGDTQRNEYLEA